MIDLQTLIDFFQTYGYAAVFCILLACGFGLPVPEDVTLVAGGVISGLGDTNVHVMLGVAMAGVLIGDCTMFTLGRFLGKRFLNFRLVKKILTEDRYQKIQNSFSKYGIWFLFFARFMPGVRSPVYIFTGVTRRVPFWKFVLVDFFAAIISVPFWIYLGYFGASNLDKLMRTIKKSQMSLLIVVFGLIIIVIAFHTLQKRIKKTKALNKYLEKIEKHNSSDDPK